MIKLALRDFKFEMMDTIIFEREKTSTLHLYNKSKNEEEYVSYMCYLIQNNFTKDQIKLIAILSTNFNFVYSYYIMAINSYFDKLILRITFFKIMFNPFLIGKKYVRKIISKRFFSLIANFKRT
jgi:hypothetical protein